MKKLLKITRDFVKLFGVGDFSPEQDKAKAIVSKFCKNFTILALTCSASLSAHGQPDNIFGMSTMVSVIPTVYVSNISSHSKTPTEKKEAKVQQFIEENRESLEVEVAQGEGEKLDTLATLYEVKEKSKWKNGLQENYEEIFYKKNKEQKSSLEVSGELTLFFETSFD